MTLGSMELYRVVHTVQRQITTQIPIESFILVIGLRLGLSLIEPYVDRQNEYATHSARHSVRQHYSDGDGVIRCGWTLNLSSAR